ncbi:MAG: AAA family ATPase [Alphaproteobacteria bacterium]
MDVADWLRNLGLEQYAAAFRDNAIDASLLPTLTAEDLRDLGVTLVGHRRRLLDAIAALGAEAASVPSAAPVPATAAADAERRQLTVLFCDLAGSTELAARLDPEDLRAIITAYHQAVARVLTGFGGFVAKYMGDGILAYFGYPQAHEEDCERAVRAALAIVDTVARLDLAEPLAVRIGIATGLVVVGDLIGEGAAQEQAVVGETPNLAARLQALAESNAIVIADATRRQIGSLFEIADLGAQALKGFAAAQEVWRVVGESGVASRFEALRSGETPLVGRDEEIELLLRRWAQAKTGEGRVVLISAEPGIGKSRLAEAVEERIAAGPQTTPHTRLRYFCSPHHEDSALYPIIGQIERAAAFARDDTAPIKQQKLAALFRDTPPDELSLLAELLSLPATQTRSEIELTPQRRKELTFEVLLGALEGLSRRTPVLMLFEDLHWMDPTSRELLDRTIARVEHLPVLLVATFRPEFTPPWTGLPHVTVLALNRLGRRDGALLVERLVGNAGLPADLIDEIVERTDGVPLFLEEVTKVVMESAGGSDATARGTLAAIPGARLAVPPTLQASLMARLDRLGPAAKQIAQVGAAIGREFSYELVAATAPQGEAETQASLGRLVAAGLVFQRGIPPTAEYQFKHALVQDTAYGTLLRGPRQALHARIADALETHSPELIDGQPDLFAQHYAEAGLVEKSVACWDQAGHKSAARSAMAEAAAQFQKGLGQLALLPYTPEHQRQELEFCSSLGAALLAVKGHAAPETGDAYARALKLWEQLGSPLDFLYIPYGRSLHHVFHGEFDLAQRLDEDLLRLSRQRDDSAGLVLGHYSSGRNLMLVGGFAASRMHLEEVLALYDPASHRALIHQAGDDPHVNAQAVLGIVLFCLGYPEQALARTNAALAAAEKLAHLPSLASSLAYCTVPFWLDGDDAALGERADQLVTMATEHSFAQWHASGTVFRGWVSVKNGDVTEGLSLLRSGSTAFRATGAEAWLPFFLAVLARACDIAGQVEEGLAQLDDALQIAGRTGQHWLEAELYRHKGQLLLRQGAAEAAEELYRNALSIAQEQEAKLWELRAAASLARLRRDQGRRAEACELLAPVYGWFTEGFDTPDLIEAKALLDELS